MNKSVAMRFAAIVVGCVVLDIVLHLATSAYSTMPAEPDYSALAERLGPGASATVWALFAFSSVAYMFYRFQDGIPGVGLKKGLRYGTSIALLWLFAMLEGVALFGNPLTGEFVTGLSDAIPILAMSALLGLFVVKHGGNTVWKRFAPGRKLLAIGIFSVIFFLGRYVAYVTGTIQSGYMAHAVHTFLWTLVMGICIGIVGILLGQAARASSLPHRALVFGLGIFGVNWAVFLVFMPIMFSGFLIDVLIRIVLDVLLVTAAYYLAFATVLKDPYVGD
ncbi:MAG: hypothetical protein JW846_11500 [Dehalococcoidia bacterium]|nr:hypothetical protein [Dehalococcoidia bacterium]